MVLDNWGTVDHWVAEEKITNATEMQCVLVHGFPFGGVLPPSEERIQACLNWTERISVPRACRMPWSAAIPTLLRSMSPETNPLTGCSAADIVRQLPRTLSAQHMHSPVLSQSVDTRRMGDPMGQSLPFPSRKWLGNGQR